MAGASTTTWKLTVSVSTVLTTFNVVCWIYAVLVTYVLVVVTVDVIVVITGV